MELSRTLTCPLYRTRKSKLITIALLLSISLFSCFSLNLANPRRRRRRRRLRLRHRLHPRLLPPPQWDFGFPNGDRKETLRLDLIQKSSSMYRDSDIIVFNTGHWWTHEKTSQGKNYYQVGDYVFRQLSVTKAYNKALETWAQWVDTNINSTKTKVFFRGYSASHFKGGQWSSGGNCDGETAPITEEVHLSPYPQMMNILESVLEKMKTPVFYLNITKMTDYRKDGHPSIYRQPETQRVPGMFQDCSHWCLPGVPDAWNELLYAALLITQQ
ncbi:hypothetical protein Scep_030783 [Stephania cephalantha]|uniref:Trichome birefringence-like C-terminal domain-containing protein n=1 Tax=Stephania cephalantha TaxID=152367 RepID=A0AAP0HGT5_9MAGN